MASKNSDIDNITFKLVDKSTVERLRRKGDITLPRKKLDVAKDERWNTKLLNSKVMQGILNGDSMDKIANSIIDVVGNNEVAARRNARTMVTGAENAGRLDSYSNLADQGVVQKKVWIATADDRTRESHLEMDGEEVDINEEFSNGLMYPGDPAGDPEEVYNCRCSMRTEIVGFRRADGSISKVEYKRDETQHEKQMIEEKERRGIEFDVESETDNEFDRYTYESFDAEADIQTEIIGKVDFGDVHKPGHEVQYAKEYKGDGVEVTKFFTDNTNNQELINSMSADEKKAFKDMWSKGKFMQGQQYKGFENMKPKERQATKIFDKYLDQATLDKGVEVVRLSDAQLVLGAGNTEGSLEALLSMEGKQITCGANMSFSAASEGLRITPVGKAPTIEYVLRIPEGTKGAGMYIGDNSINIWGDKQREFMTNRDIWMTVGKTEYNASRDIYRVELSYGGLMDHVYK